MSEHPLHTYLAQHPRMIGTLFLLGMLLLQAGPAMAAGSTIGGP